MLKQLQVLEGHTDVVWCIAWSPDGTRLASCGADKTVRIWGYKDDQQGWSCVGILDDTHSRTVRCVAWSPDGSHLAVASFDATTSVWRSQGDYWEHVGLLEGHENEVKSVAWNTQGSLLATCGRDKSVWIWEVLPGEEYECVDVKTGHTQDVKCVVWHPQQPVLVSCSYDDSIKVWQEQADDWECVQTLTGHAGTVWSAAFDASGSVLVTCSDDGSIRVWQWHVHSNNGNGPARCTPLATLPHAHTRSVFSVSWCPTRDLVASGGADNAINVYTVHRGGELEGGKGGAGHMEGEEGGADIGGENEMEQGGEGMEQGAQVNKGEEQVNGIEKRSILESGEQKQELFTGAHEQACRSDSSLHVPPSTTSPSSTVPSSSTPPSSTSPLLHCTQRIQNAHEVDVNCVAWRPGVDDGPVQECAQQHACVLASCGDDGLIKLWG